MPSLKNKNENHPYEVRVSLAISSMPAMFIERCKNRRMARHKRKEVKTESRRYSNQIESWSHKSSKE
jgi:ABC-type multidrug transport system fused ATPase/permease subunit